jgi:creatinine amidohydrolase
MPSIRWGELTAPDLALAAQQNALVILPLGCTEQHAAHLPVDTDTYQVERVTMEGAQKAAERFAVHVLVLPPLPFGPASEHYGLPGTISLPNEVYLPLLKAILHSVIELGFRRIAVVKGCTGHFIVPAVLWDVKAETARAGRDMTLRVWEADDDWRMLKEKYFPGADGGHASVMETALCLADRAHLVRTDAVRAPELRMVWERYRGGETFLFKDATSTGALGDAAPATVEGGRALWTEISDAFAARLKATEEQDKQLGRL